MHFSQSPARWLWSLLMLIAFCGGLWANPPGEPKLCPVITGDNVSCVNQLEPYASANLPGYVYAWGVSAGGTLANLTGPTTMVNWNAAGPGYVVLYSTPPGGTMTSCTLNVTVYPQPTPDILTDFVSDCPEKGQHGAKLNINNPTQVEECWVVCENTTVNYWTNPVAGNTYNWIIVGGTPVTATGSSITVTWGAAGSGSIILTETAPGGCSETVEICVDIIESPIAKFEFNGQDPSSALTICKGETVYFSDLSVGAAYWLWDFGDGTTSTLQNPAHTYDVPGTYYGSLTVKNECGCTDKLPFKIIVKNVASPDIGCISTVCLNDCAYYSVSNLGNCPGAVVDWSIHGGQIQSQPDPYSVNVIWDDSDGYIAAYGYGLICVRVSGCPDVCDAEVCVRVPVIHQASIKGDIVVCVGDPVTYSLPVQPGINEPGNPPNGVDFHWVLSGGGTILSSSPYSNTVTVEWLVPGTWTIDVESYENYLSDQDCKFDPDPITITVKPKFNISPQTATVCVGTAQPFGLSGLGAFDWTVTGPGGTTTTTGLGNTHAVTPALPGTYAVSAVSTSGVYCNIEPVAVLTALPLPPAPVGSLTGDLSVCLNTPYTYTFNTPPPAGTVYEWTAVNGTVFPTSGQTATVIWTGGAMSLSIKTRYAQNPPCPSAPLTFNVTQYVPPTNFVTGTMSVCVNELGYYNASGLANVTNYQWTVVPATAGSVVSGQGTPNIQVLFNSSAPATAQVVCTATVCGSPVSANKTVNITQIPTYSVTASDPSPCQYSNVSLGVIAVPGLLGIESYSWNFGDGSPLGSGPTPTHSWAAAGSYPVTVQITTCGGQNVFASMTIVVKPVPVVAVTATNGFVVCPPLVNSTNLVASTQTFCNYSWSSPASTGSIYNVTTPGTYTVVATDPANGCSSTAETEVVGCGNCTSNCNSLTAPWTFTAAEACDSYTFTPNTTAAIFQSWNFGDGTFSYSPGAVTHTYAHPGYYQVRLTTIDPINGCVMRVVQTITVKFKGKFTVNYSCASGFMQTILTDISEYLPGFTGAITWKDFGSTIGTGTPFTTTLSAGAHSISMHAVVGAQNCSVGPIPITVPSMPSASFTNTAPACEGVPVLFTNTSTGGFTNYSWNFGDLSTSAAASPSHTYDAPPSTFTVTLSISNNWGCTSTATAVLPIATKGPDPVISALPDFQECEGSPILLSSTPLMSSYKWFKAPNLPPPALSTAPSYTPTLSGTYGLISTDANGCVYNVLSSPVVYIPPPYVQITGKVDYCLGELIDLTAENGLPGYTYTWNATTPYGTNTFFGSSILQYGGLPGTYTYTVNITHTATGCSNSGTISVVVHPGVTGLTITSSANCEPAVLTASGTGAVMYNWNTGDNTASINATESGFYSVVATDNWGCTARATYDLEGRPDLSNVMTGCYDFCEPVEWQAINCSGCTYQWYLNGSPITGANGPTYLMTSSGVYTVVVSNGPGCESTSDPIDVSISSSPDLCYKCDVYVKDLKIECIGIDPVTGLPLYEFTMLVQNNGGAITGLDLFSSFGGVTIDSPVGGFIPGGGALTPVHGFLHWDGSGNYGCIYGSGFILRDCQPVEECRIDWCFDLPKCCEKPCDLKAYEPIVTCLTNGFYQVDFFLKNNGCKLTDLFVKTDLGIFPVNPSMIGTGVNGWYSVIIPANPGWANITICGYTLAGDRCCTELHVFFPECGSTNCKLEIVSDGGASCVSLNDNGYWTYNFNMTVYGVPPGSSFVLIPEQPGLISGVTYSCVGTTCTIQGNFAAFSDKNYVCITVLSITSTDPPKVCIGKICFELPHCDETGGKPAEERSNLTQNNRAKGFDFEMSPNPAFDQLRLDLRLQSNASARVLVTDMIGQRKIEAVLTESRTTLDLRQLSSGLYNVSVTDADGQTVTKKLMVIRN